MTTDADPTTDAADPDEPGPGNAGLLRDRRFGPFFVANLASNTGNWFQNLAAGIVVFDLTGSNALVGAVSMIQFSATLLLTTWAGALTDRHDPRPIFLRAQMTSFAGAASLAATVLVVGVDDLPGAWVVFLATAIIGTGYAFSLPSMQSLVPRLVPRDRLDGAIALNSVTFNLARAVGPVLAGLTVDAFGVGVAFAVNTLTFVPLIVVLATVRPRRPATRSRDGGDESTGSVREALGIARRDPTILALLGGILAVGIASDPINTLAPGIADHLGRGDGFVGIFVGCFGAGSAVAAFTIDGLRSAVGRPNAIPAGLGILAVGLGGIALAPVWWLVLVAAGVAGYGFLVGVTSTNAELQRHVDDDVRGRIMALWSLCFLGVRPVAAPVDGFLGDALDPQRAVLAATAAAVVGFVAMLRLRPVGGPVSEPSDPGADGPRRRGEPSRS